MQGIATSLAMGLNKNYLADEGHMIDLNSYSFRDNRMHEKHAVQLRLIRARFAALENKVQKRAKNTQVKRTGTDK